MNKSDIDFLRKEQTISDEHLLEILTTTDQCLTDYLKSSASEVAVTQFGHIVKARGLIEISNYCKNNCYYCGIRAANRAVDRYRLSHENIIDCCARGAELGFKTFVLQGGEDPLHSSEWVEHLIEDIHEKWPDRAITLSLGERPERDYKRWFDAGANRYLLRHETASVTHYNLLHPKDMDFDNRRMCIMELKRIGYETGTGMMVGTPYQKVEDLVKDLRFIEELHPEMIGIGPFVSHHQTPFANCENGSVETTLRLISILRLMHPEANIPATTSLGTLAKNGRELGIKAGANVVMPNLSPVEDRGKYSLYDNKICMDLEAAESRVLLSESLAMIGYTLD